MFSKLQLVLGINTKNVIISTSVMSLVYTGEERHLEGPLLHKHMMGEAWR